MLSARAEAAEAIRAAAVQTAWTQETMQSLLDTAEQEAERLRAAGRADAGRHVAEARRQVQGVVHRMTERLRARLAEAERQAEALAQAGRSMVATAEQDAARIRAEADEAAAAALAAAEDEAMLVHERAQRRQDETEASTRVLRQQTADEMVRQQRTGQDELRRAREEATETVASARAEADELRSKARAVLEDARTEAAVLTRRRDEIAAELGGLSGVIQALAVPTDAADETPPEEKEAH